MRQRNLVTPKRKIRKKAIAIIVALGLLIALLFGLYKKTQFPKTLLTVNAENKQAGTHEVSKIKEKDYIAALHYPKIKHEALNAWLTEEKDKMITLIKSNTKENEKIMALQDYESYQIGDYTSVKLDLSINEETIYQSMRTFDKEAMIPLATPFDTQGGRIMTDLIRKNSPQNETSRDEYLENTQADHFYQFMITPNDLIIQTDQMIKKPLEETTVYLKADLGDIKKTDGIAPSVYLDKGVSGNDKLIAFTFDDGPHYEVTEKLMDVLEKYNGQGTFFMVGQRVEGQEAIVKSVLDRGHQLANHSFDHPNFNTIPKEDYQEQINKTNAEFKRATGYEGPYMVRPPYGEANKETRSNTNSVFVNWSIDTMDWASHNPSAICDNITKYAHDGGIVLMHDLYETSYEGFKCGIEKLSQQGYQFVTVEELLKAKGVEIKEQNLYFDAY
ncbi:MAG TPA: polysaccharide deacetylase family protein [Erysipelothrix sp.]